MHIYNRTPTRTIGWKTLHKLWSAGHTPDVSYAHIFGCKAYVHVPDEKRKKLDPQAIEMTFVGYEPGSKGYRLWNHNSCAIILSRDVMFDERVFPHKADSQLSISPSPLNSVPDGSVTISLPEREQGGTAPPQTPQIAAPTVPTVPMRE